ncbi:hypothetical protein F5Y06DRAFT_255925 [Hypoxylon sp. FL0890]|nr:hypothetical protein F5Y06DRAFT_255925 [Hypoxylon sp. FL0890]
MATSSGTKRKNDCEAIVEVTSKKSKPSNSWSSLVFHPDDPVDKKVAQNTESLSVNHRGRAEPFVKSKVLNAPVASTHDSQLPNDTETENSQDANEGQAAIRTASTEEFVQDAQYNDDMSGPARESPASCSLICPTIFETKMNEAVNPSGYEKMVKKSDDAVVELIKMCHGLRDRNDEAVLIAQINMGRKYCSLLEENEKLRGELSAREARYRHMAGKLLETELALSAKDARLKEAETRLIAKQALEYLEAVSN